LLQEVGLPGAGVREHFQHFWVARADDGIVGCAGLEPYGPSALLRSVAVASTHRGRGLGRALTARILEEARRRGIARIFLLTETAADFFRAFGFSPVGRDVVDAGVRQSIEFTTACCPSAVCMRRDL
jgi:amino-acid N-acetyltransferase